MSQVDIRELNERIERQSAFVDSLMMEMDIPLLVKSILSIFINWFIVRRAYLVGRCTRLAKTLAIKTLASLIVPILVAYNSRLICCRRRYRNNDCSQRKKNFR